MRFGDQFYALFQGIEIGPQSTELPQESQKPITVTDRYFTDEGRSTRINVLANDYDPNDDRFSLFWVGNPANGTAVRNADGTITYTPNAGFSGVETFTYRTVDERRYSSAEGDIIITVHPAPEAPPGDILLHYTFDYGMEGMRYADDRFGAAGSGDHARGTLTDGSLGVVLGADDATLTEDLSGGWRVEFTLAETKSLLLEFTYNVSLAGGLEQNEQLSVIASLDQTRLGPSEGPLGVHNTLGDGVDVETGWIAVSLELGDIGAGTHVLDIGAHLGRRNDVDEIATLLIDDLTLYSNPADGPVATNDDPKPTPLTTRLSSDSDLVFLRAFDEEIDASFGDDEVNGMGGNDLIFGSSGDDTLRGAKGDDTLVGGDGDDVMWGGSGNDVLWGGDGVDVMVGDADSDTFRFSDSSWGTVDRLRDFSEDDGDILDVSYLVTGFSGAGDLAGYVEIFENDGNTILKVDRDGGADSFERVAVLVNTLGISDAATLYSDGMLLL